MISFNKPPKFAVVNRSFLPLKGISVEQAKILKSIYMKALTKSLYRCIGLAWFLASGLVASVDQDSMASNLPSPLSMASIRERVRVDNMDNLIGIVFGTGGIEKIQSYLKEGANPNLVDREDQQSLLEMFCFKGNEEMVNLLIEHEVFVPYLDKNNHHALYCIASIEKKDYREAHGLIADQLIQDVTKRWGREITRAMLNQSDLRGITSLHMASVRGHLAIVTSLVRNGADLDQADLQGRTALHFACYMGHENVIRHLLDYGSSVVQTSLKGLSAKDFFKVGALEEEVRRNPRIEEILEIGQVQRQNDERIRMFANESLREFFITFQRKCGGIFLAYRTLDSGAVQGTKDTLCVSNAINVLGDLIPLPGAGMVTTAASTAVGMLEDQWEAERKKNLTEFFATINEMETAVAQGASELINTYQEKIVQLTPRGATVLAECGVARFVAYMRDRHTEFDRMKSLSAYIIESVHTEKANSFLAQFTFWQRLNRLETKDPTLNWTDQEIFQGAVQQTSLLTLPLTPVPTQNNDTNPNNQALRQSGCCVVS